MSPYPRPNRGVQLPSILKLFAPSLRRSVQMSVNESLSRALHLRVPMGSFMVLLTRQGLRVIT
jgi:hypothetical protein